MLSHNTFNINFNADSIINVNSVNDQQKNIFDLEKNGTDQFKLALKDQKLKNIAMKAAWP